MAKKTKKTKKDNKNLIIGICAAVVVLVVVVVAVVLATGGSQLNDDYFKSDDTKYVLNYDTGSLDLDVEDEYAEFMPLKTHIVYTYDGDTITSMKTYAEYADAAAAKTALDKMKEAGEADDGAILDGKYIVVTADESEYKDTKASDVKRQIEVFEMLQNMNSESESESGSDSNLDSDLDLDGGSDIMTEDAR